MQVGTYPTRNFATLGTFVTRQSGSPDRRARSFLPGSACRHAGRTVSSPSYLEGPGVQSLRIPSTNGRRFPADCPHSSHCHWPPLPGDRVVRDTGMFQHIARFCNGRVDRYSSRFSPYRYEAWTISSPTSFNSGALRMASEDSDHLKLFGRALDHALDGSGH